MFLAVMLNNSAPVSRVLSLNVRERVLWSTCFLVESVFIVIGNLIALSIFAKKRPRVNKSTYFLISLTIADFFVGVSTALASLPLILFSDGYRNPSYVIVNAYSICTVFSTFSSIVLLTAIALERAFAIVFPIKHRLANQRHYFIAIWGSVALSFVISCTVVLLQSVVPREYSEEHPEYSSVFMIAVSLTLLVIIISAYFTIWVKTRFLSKKNERLTTLKRNKKIAKTLFIVTAFSMATWLPEGILLGYTTFLCGTCRFSAPKHVYMFTDVILYGNSFVNLFVYALRMPYFRKELSKLLRCSSRPLSRPGKQLRMKTCTTRTTRMPIMLLSIQTKR